MKLNYDCVRDLLLTLEECLQYDDNLKVPTVRLNAVSSNSRMSAYCKADIVYSSKMLEEAGYIESRMLCGDNRVLDIVYWSISFDGHQYLDSVRSSKIWGTLKEKITNASLALTFDLIKAEAIKLALSLL